MKNKYYIIAGKMLSGELNDNEVEQFNAWLNKNENNMKWFKKLKKGWDVADNMEVRKEVDVDTAWGKVFNRIQAEDIHYRVSPSISTNKSLVPVFIKVAAIGLMLFAMGIIAYKMFNFNLNGLTNQQIVETTSTEQKNIELPDGSTVFLSYSSKISYPKHFAKDKRMVNLNGEAFFSVTKNPKKPFLIAAGNAVVRVVGTSFSVRSDDANKNVEVFVNTGKVEIYSRKSPDKVVSLEPGYIGSITTKNTEKYLNKNENYLSWKTKRLVFNGASLNEVIDVLSQTYNTTIILDNQDLGACKFTSSFENQELDIVLQIIKETLGLTIEKKDNIVYISGKACK